MHLSENSLSVVKKAFVLGAGLGTRLRPLTEFLPKPLVPVMGRPLITFAFEHLREAGVDSIMVNTHHCPEAYEHAFPELQSEGVSLTFRHEPVLLETGGGIWNIRDWVGQETFWVFNGDVFSTLPLERALEQHRREGNLATLVLRSSGGPLQMAMDPKSGRILDIRNRLGVAAGEFLFSGIYLLEPDIVEAIPAGEKISIVETFLSLIRDGRKIGGVVIDEGIWRDLGNPEEYFRLHREIASGEIECNLAKVNPSARLGTDVHLTGCSWVGAGAEIGDGACLIDTMVWAGARVLEGVQLDSCVVREGMTADRSASNEVF